MQRFGDEVLFHHEFSRAGSQRVAFALPLVVYFDDDQLREPDGVVRGRRLHIFDPHTWVLEDGGMKQVDELQLAFKRDADPMGLMNPGKVRAWDERVLGIARGRAVKLLVVYCHPDPDSFSAAIRRTAVEALRGRPRAARDRPLRRRLRPRVHARREGQLPGRHRD
jgi:hypothetical protein